MREMPTNTIDTNLAVEAVELGKLYDLHATEAYQKINDTILEIQSRLQHTIFSLKTALSHVKAKDPDAKEFDISDHWDLILDFQETLNEAKGENKSQPIFGPEEFEKSKTVSKADLEQLIEQLSNAADDKKHQIQYQTNLLFTQANLALTLYDALNKILRAALQSHERRAQQVGKTF